MAQNKNDELNVINESQAKAIDYEEYFGGEELTEEQRKERIEFANDMELVILFAFALISVFTSEDNYQYTIIVEQLADRYKQVISRYTNVDEYLEKYTKDFSEQITSTTLDNLLTVYFLSRERATVIAANEADTILNRKDYVNAVLDGKTKKTWVDVRDNRERMTHLQVGGKTVGINELFQVGNCMMRYPHDAELGNAEELINCRCQCKYS